MMSSLSVALTRPIGQRFSGRWRITILGLDEKGALNKPASELTHKEEEAATDTPPSEEAVCFRRIRIEGLVSWNAAALPSFTWIRRMGGMC